MAAANKEYTNTNELSKELFSTVRFAATLLSSTSPASISHCEHIPDSYGLKVGNSFNDYKSCSCPSHKSKVEEGTQMSKQTTIGKNCKEKHYFLKKSTPSYKVSHGRNVCNCESKHNPDSTLIRNMLVQTFATKSSAISRRKEFGVARRASASRTKFRWLPRLGATSFVTLLTLVCLETVLLSTVSSCAKTFYMHWNTSNSIFRIDNTDHIIDVNKGNLAFEFDQVHIICPVYEPGTYENETEKYIIYNVSKVEYETCRITNADPRVIAICDKPQKLMFFTITFRPFTPQPGGLEFLPGNDYYFISTSSKDDLYRRIGGRCSTNNMKVVFKVCCASEEKNKTISSANPTRSSAGSVSINESVGSGVGAVGEPTHGVANTPTNINQHHVNTINTGSGVMNVNDGGNGLHLKPIGGAGGTSINTNIDHFNRIPIQTNGINVIGNSNVGGVGGNGIVLTPGHGGINMIPTGGGGGIVQYPGMPGQSGIRINNVPSQQHHPSRKNNNNDVHYDKHPNEVVKNEELTYNSAATTLHPRNSWICQTALPGFISGAMTSAAVHFNRYCGFASISKLFNAKQLIASFHPMALLLVAIIAGTHFMFKLTLSSTSSLSHKVDVNLFSNSENASRSPVKHSECNKNARLVVWNHR